MAFHNNSIFWIEVEKIKPNPYQPRREFDEAKLSDLADSIKQYGVLQPLVVIRREVFPDGGGMTVEYELIAGERRLRASKMAGLYQVPAVIREGEEDENVKLELAIIENLQREDLNAVDRAQAFDQLARKFGYKHAEIARKIGKSREYVSNSVRILALPEEIRNALIERRITEGHTRPLLMLTDRPEEQTTLFKEIMSNRLKVREAEIISRRIARDRARKKERSSSPDIIELEEKTGEALGARVVVEEGESGGKLTIPYFSEDDLRKILSVLSTGFHRDVGRSLLPGGMVGSFDEEEEQSFSSADEDDSFSLEDFTV